jgi:transposase InsO family protein
VRFSFIDRYRGFLPRTHLCRLLVVTDRGLRAWRRRPPSRRQRADMALLTHIRDRRRTSLGSYGRPRMTEELKELGLDVRHRRVGRLMRQNGVEAIRTRKCKATTDGDHSLNISPNLLGQDFWASRPNQKWAGDISYIRTHKGWVYLAVILNLHSRRAVGWAISNRLKSDLAVHALVMATALRRPPNGCIHHTDRGSQYCSHNDQKLLLQHGLRTSMSGRGNCHNNAAVETFSKTIKVEMIWRRSWPARRSVEVAPFGYINGFLQSAPQTPSPRLEKPPCL